MKILIYLPGIVMSVRCCDERPLLGRLSHLTTTTRNTQQLCFVILISVHSFSQMQAAIKLNGSNSVSYKPLAAALSRSTYSEIQMDFRTTQSNAFLMLFGNSSASSMVRNYSLEASLKSQQDLSRMASSSCEIVNCIAILLEKVMLRSKCHVSL